ncbi:MAG: glycosyl hydrolase [Balneolaceae bacterium]|nr:MAG: glycosyl hydrolase [Balneolaceae bacterium]
MSYRKEKFQNFRGTDVPDQIQLLKEMSGDDLKKTFREILEDGVHGFCYSLYEEGQKPGDVISAEQIRRRMTILQPHTSWIRSFSCIEGNENIPKIAKEMGMNTLVGAWLGDDPEKNREEIDALVQLAREGYVDIAAVGNEVLYRKELTEDELLGYIAEVKEKLPDIPVGYVDAYYEFFKRPRLAEASDVILCNCYPFWEGTALEHSLDHMRHMFQLALDAGNGKRVIITETGWPSDGQPLGGAQPSTVNAMKYFISAQLWANANNIESFYFSSFDESWKVGNEGDVGAFWGVWDSNGKPKFF